MQTSTGSLVYINGYGNAAIFDAPYRNKYGEITSQYEKDYHSFQIDSQGGGKEALKKARDHLVSNMLPNEIV